MGIAGAAAVDTLIDGAMISAGFSTGNQLGGLLTVALAVEPFFLNLSVGTEFHNQKS
jgi:zinc transporter ZupT